MRCHYQFLDTHLTYPDTDHRRRRPRPVRLRGRDSVPVDGGEVRFLALGLPGLIDSKRAAGWTRDLAQIPELEALLEITKLGPQSGGE